MEGLEAASDVVEGFPYFCLFDAIMRFGVLVDQSHDVAAGGVLHDYA